MITEYNYFVAKPGEVPGTKERVWTLIVDPAVWDERASMAYAHFWAKPTRKQIRKCIDTVRARGLVHPGTLNEPT